MATALMIPAAAFARRHQLSAFLVLAFALSWSPWLWSEPGQVGLLPVGPFLAALAMLAVAGERRAVGAWLRKIVHWRVRGRWYALVLLGPPALTFTAVAIALGTGATPLPAATAPGAAALAGQFVLALVWVGLGEEPAWRGFALPRLLARRPVLAAALLLGLIHIVWHAPLFGVEYDLANGIPWAVSVLAVSVVTAWMWLHTGGSLLLPVLLHAANNSVAFAWAWFTGPDQLRLWWAWAGLWAAAAGLVTVDLILVRPSSRRTPLTAGGTP